VWEGRGRRRGPADASEYRASEPTVASRLVLESIDHFSLSLRIYRLTVVDTLLLHPLLRTTQGILRRACRIEIVKGASSLFRISPCLVLLPRDRADRVLFLCICICWCVGCRPVEVETLDPDAPI